MAGAADLGKLFKPGGVGEQLLVWGLLQQLIGAALAPQLELVTRGVNALQQTTPLTPEQLADMVNRAIVSLGDGEAYAKQSGISPSDFLRLVQAAGDAISPQEAVTAFRRGLIPREGRGPDSLSLEQAIAESRIRDKWVGTIEQLGMVPVPVADAVDAVVEGQITFDEGAHFAFLNGVSREDFTILVNTRGNPPSVTELLEMNRRGLIPLEGTGPDVLSVQQGIFEGATKDKWWQRLAALIAYLPPPRTVTALVREGSITDDQALALFKQSGLSQELATAYLESAHHQKLLADKQLAKADVLQLYRDQLIDAQTATALLAADKYTAQEIAWLLQMEDLRRAIAFVNKAVERIHTLYVGWRIDKVEAVADLDALHVPPAQRDQLLALWDIERNANVKDLTAAEIASAFFYKVIDQDTAITELERIGYDERKAWILLSVRQHGPIANPPAGVTVPQRGQ